MVASGSYRLTGDGRAIYEARASMVVPDSNIACGKSQTIHGVLNLLD
jgi:hypothetical protein